MAFTRATGKHRAPSRLTRTRAKAVGVAALATTGVIGGLAAPALAADSGTPSVSDTGLGQVIAIDKTLADRIDAQADAQQHQADAAAKAKAEAQRKAEAEKKAEAKAKAKAKADAKRAAEARAEKARAARSAERTRLSAFQLPVAGSYVTTGYKSSGSLWSSGSHSGIDFHAASGSSVVAVGAGTVVEAAGAARTATTSCSG